MLKLTGVKTSKIPIFYVIIIRDRGLQITNQEVIFLDTTILTTKQIAEYVNDYLTSGWLNLSEVAPTYEHIMASETMLRRRKGLSSWQYPEASEAYGAARQVLEYAKLCLIPRSANGLYNNFTDEYTPFSVGAHTFLTLAVTLMEYKFLYGTRFTHTEYGYSWLVTTETILRHDIAEVLTRDIADNKARNEFLKNLTEEIFLGLFAKWSPYRDRAHESIIECLSSKMRRRQSIPGRTTNLPDKATAIAECLICNKSGIPYLVDPDDPRLSEHDLEEISYCELSKDGLYYASEMWSVDYFKLRKRIDDDDYGYCTALLVMCTLLVHDNYWYSWREADYQNLEK